MELTSTDYEILKAIYTGRVSSGTPVNHFVDYCDNVIGGNPKPLVDAGYIVTDHNEINGLTDKGTKAYEEHAAKESSN